MSHLELKQAMWMRQAGDTAPLILGLRPRVVEPDRPVWVVRIESTPIVSPRAQKYLASYPARVFMALQALSLALAWEELVEGGLRGELDILEMMKISFDTVSAAAQAGKLYYELSAARQAALSRVGHSRGLNVARAGSLQKALVGAKVLGVAGIVTGIGSSAIGMIADMEKAEQAWAEGERELFDRRQESSQLHAAGVITGVLMLGALIAAPVVGAGAVVVAVVAAVAEVVIFIRRLFLDDEIERLDLSPLEKWLKYGYWGVEPYAQGKRTVNKQGLTIIDYSELRDDLNLELRVIENHLYAFTAKLTWILEKGYRSFGKSVRRHEYEPEVALDVYLPNPGTRLSQLYVSLVAMGADHESGRREVLFAGDVSVHPGGAMAELPERVRLERFRGEALPVYERIRGSSRKVKPDTGGITLRFRVKQADLPEHTAAVSARMAFDPLGTRVRPVPDRTDGVSVFLAKQFRDDHKKFMEDEKTSIESFNWAQLKKHLG